ncbi:MAG TPA: oxygen-independent coproporphyrinogen III oxidase, partial [Cytophagales bacterium]|nr:oxygen-independent coproporphyrinogen III oxidase [Cytophagales bacterium]
MEHSKWIDRYNTPAPRYTSYPTVPYWQDHTPTPSQWAKLVLDKFKVCNTSEGISIYVHLPYCESLCTYCGCNTRITINHAVERPYIDTLLKEWQLYLDLFGTTPQIKDLHLGGGTPTFFSPQNLKHLIEGLLSTCNLHLEAEFSFEAHPANTTQAHLKVLYDLNFRRLSLGIQDFDPLVQDTIHRFQTPEQVQHVSALARDLGYSSINFDMIYGLPKQTLNGIKDTVAKVITLKPDRIAYYSYAHVPWHKPGQRRFTEADLPTAEEKQLLYETGKQMLTAAGYIDIGMDHFSLPNEAIYRAQQAHKLHRNFMGYTDKKTELLIGLGTSSISDTGDAYMQNIKVVEAYTQKIQQGQFAVHKGIVLSDKDIYIKSLINKLICDFEAEWQEDHFSISERLQVHTRLAALEIDGLITMIQNYIKVTALGQKLIRNICMAF